METMIKDTLSHDELVYYLICLRDRIAELSERELKNIIFLNAESFYVYIRLFTCGFGGSVDEILQILEPYIPFTLNDGNIELFLEGIFLPEDEKEQHQMHIASKAKTDFVFALKHMKTEDELERMLNVCEQLRLIHEKSINFQFM